MIDAHFEQLSGEATKKHGGHRRGRRFDPEQHCHLNTVVTKDCLADLKALAESFDCGSVGEVIEGLSAGYLAQQRKQQERRAA